MMRRAARLVVLAALTAGCGAAAREAAPRTCVVHVYFCRADLCDAAATEAQIAAVRARFRARDDVWSVRFTPKAEALRRMKKLHPDEVAMLPANPFPDALVVRPVKGGDSSEIAVESKAGQGGVQKVAFARDPVCVGD